MRGIFGKGQSFLGTKPTLNDPEVTPFLWHMTIFLGKSQLKQLAKFHDAVKRHPKSCDTVKRHPKSHDTVKRHFWLVGDPTPLTCDNMYF